MKLVPTNTQIQHAKAIDNKTQDDARTLLKKIAANLVNANGSVKNGYLRMSGNNFSAGHMGSGASKATNILLLNVLHAYGHGAQQALQTYLDSTSAKNGSVGKIGTRSFVALIKKMEAGELQNPNEALDATSLKLSTARLGTHRLATQNLQPLYEQHPDFEPEFSSLIDPKTVKPFQAIEGQPRDSSLADQQDDFNVRLSERAQLPNVMVPDEAELAPHEPAPIIAAPKVVRSTTYSKELKSFHEEKLQPIQRELGNIINAQNILEVQIKRIIEANHGEAVHHLDELRSWMRDQISASLEGKPIEEIASEVHTQPKSALIKLADQWLTLEDKNKTLRQHGLNELRSKLTDLSHRAQEQMTSQSASDETINATLQNLLRTSSSYAITLNTFKSPGLPGIEFEDKVSPLNGLPEFVTRYPVWNRTINQGGVSSIQDETGRSWTNSKMMARTQSNGISSSNPRLVKGDAPDGLPKIREWIKHVYHLKDPSSGKSNAMLVQESGAGIPAFAAGGSVYAKLDDTFPDAPWKPTVRGYAANESGMHWILEDMAPLRAMDDAMLNQKLQFNRPARIAVMRDMTEMMSALHDKGWALDKEMHELSTAALAIGVDGNLKLFESPKDNATTRMMQNDVQQLAFQFLTSACDNKFTGLISQPFQNWANWSPLNNQEALGNFVNYALLTPDQWAAYSRYGGGSELSEPDPGSLFMEDGEVRQAAYKALGLSAYANWLERAISGAEEGASPATALELSQLIARNEKPADPRIRQFIRLSAEKLNHPFYD